jgi:hypothetical protein
MHERPVTVHEIEQGSDGWWALRTGHPTASSLSRIIQPEKLGYSTGARGYAAELIGERMLGGVLDRTGSGLWTDYGKAGEDFGRKWYEWHYDVDVREVGSVTTELVRVDKAGDPVSDEGGFVHDVIVGSPDGLVGDEGIVEIKCPKATTHMQYLTRHKSLSGEYRIQTQAYLWLTGRAWCDLIAFNPDLPKIRVRVYPEEDVQEAITNHLQRFFRELATAERKLHAMGDVVEEDEELKWELIESVRQGAMA